MLDKKADFDPVKIAQGFEIFETALSSLAPLFKSYYDELVQAGFSKEEAFVLTVHFHDLEWSAVIGK